MNRQKGGEEVDARVSGKKNQAPETRTEKKEKGEKKGGKEKFDGEARRYTN